jgi:hypothetical protein
MGVREFRIPPNDPSIRVRAIANKKAGNKLPITALNATSGSLFNSIFLHCKKAKGSKTRAAAKMRNEAICEPVRAPVLSFISLKELPQIIERSTKSNQLINLLDIGRKVL